MPACARDVADAGAHEAGADDADLLELGRRHVRRAARALVQLLHRRRTGVRIIAAASFERRILAK